MALFRPYEQGKTRPTSTETAGTAVGSGTAPGKRRRAGRSGASAAPRPAGVDQAGVETVTTTRDSASPTRDATTQDVTPAAAGPRQPQKKGTRTPTRAEAEAARMERLHPTLSPKEMRKAQREAGRAQQQANLRAVDASPGRTLMRDHVDAHWSLLEFTMPLCIALLLVTFGFAGRNYTMQYALDVVMTVLLALMVLNAWWMWRTFKQLAQSRGIDPKQRGLMMYGVNRMMAFRAIRQPKPRIKRGESY